MADKHTKQTIKTSFKQSQSILNKFKTKIRNNIIFPIHDAFETYCDDLKQKVGDDLYDVWSTAGEKYEDQCTHVLDLGMQGLAHDDGWIKDYEIGLFIYAQERLNRLRDEQMEIQKIYDNFPSDHSLFYMKTRVISQLHKIKKTITKMERKYDVKILSIKLEAARQLEGFKIYIQKLKHKFNRKVEKLFNKISTLSCEISELISTHLNKLGESAKTGVVECMTVIYNGPTQAYEDFIEVMKPVFVHMDPVVDFVDQIPDIASLEQVEGSFPPMLTQILIGQSDMDGYFRVPSWMGESQINYQLLMEELNVKDNGDEEVVRNESELHAAKIYPSTQSRPHYSPYFPLEKYQKPIADLKDGTALDAIEFVRNLSFNFEPVAMRYSIQAHSTLPLFQHDVRGDHHLVGQPKRLAIGLSMVRLKVLRMRRKNPFVFWFHVPKVLFDYTLGRGLNLSKLFEAHVKQDSHLMCPEIADQVTSAKTVCFGSTEETAKINLGIAAKNCSSVNFPYSESYSSDAIYENSGNFGLRRRAEILWSHYYDPQYFRL